MAACWTDQELGCAVILGIIILGLLTWGSYKLFSTGPGDLQTAPAASPCPGRDAPALQEKRRQFIAESIQRGLFLKIEDSSSTVYCYTGRPFDQLTFEQKSTVLDPIYSYYYCGPRRLQYLVLLDGYTGKRIGRFSILYGGLEMF